MDGFISIDKPESWTSHDVVAKVRNILKNETGKKIKVGHTGTLDPAATGLMILVIGSYCKRAEQFSRLNKTYKVELMLGMTSTTADSEGEIIQKNTHKPSKNEIIEVLNKFVGKISQVPPVFSAIKVGGKRAYKLAREGKEVILEPRNVTIFDIGSVSYEYPKLRFTTQVSSGTYIRSLAVDIGEKLGTGAYMSALRRISIDNYDINEALPLSELDFARITAHLKR